MIIRYATTEDIAAIAAVEAECFPPAEAATAKEFVDRVKYYGNHFWLMYEAEKLIAFVDGFVTDERDLTDVMYEDATLHNENGAWQMIFGVNTIPAYRKQGYAGELIGRAVCGWAAVSCSSFLGICLANPAAWALALAYCAVMTIHFLKQRQTQPC